MAIVVEDGTQVENANSYVTELELTDYATARGLTVTGDTEELLIKAMDYIESLDYVGVKASSTQELQWPRYNVIIDDYYQNADSIPKELKKAQIETALSIDSGIDPLADISRSIKSASVGSISVEYSPGRDTTLVRKISAYLHKLLHNTGTSFQVLRG